jgi:hypothetical protein
MSKLLFYLTSFTIAAGVLAPAPPVVNYLTYISEEETGNVTPLTSESKKDSPKPKTQENNTKALNDRPTYSNPNYYYYPSSRFRLFPFRR